MGTILLGIVVIWILAVVYQAVKESPKSKAKAKKKMVRRYK